MCYESSKKSLYFVKKKSAVLILPAIPERKHICFYKKGGHSNIGSTLKKRYNMIYLCHKSVMCSFLIHVDGDTKHSFFENVIVKMGINGRLLR